MVGVGVAGFEVQHRPGIGEGEAGGGDGRGVQDGDITGERDRIFDEHVVAVLEPEGSGEGGLHGLMAEGTLGQVCCTEVNGDAHREGAAWRELKRLLEAIRDDGVAVEFDVGGEVVQHQLRTFLGCGDGEGEHRPGLCEINVLPLEPMIDGSGGIREQEAAGKQGEEHDGTLPPGVCKTFNCTLRPQPGSPFGRFDPIDCP